MAMNQLMTRVNYILHNEPMTRNSDDKLYWAVIRDFMGDAAATVTAEELLTDRKGLGLPPYESVGRARRKLQEKNPALKAVPEVQRERAELEKEFRDWARSN